ncbi:bifunctional nuclease domain-containing protein [Maridesulfovibrio sp.]|uniref:bifunctional nuclease domain-containing protein n=1 Tax=Maridesulfovibrio sp. TaxID=2795000 RepID=UPI003B007691
MTHDLLLSTVATFGGEVVSVDIVDIEQGTFYAEIMVRKDGELVAIIRSLQTLSLCIAGGLSGACGPKSTYCGRHQRYCRKS